MAITQKITFAATPPALGDSPEVFESRAIGVWNQLKNITTPEFNTFADQANELRDEVNTLKNDAEGFKDTAATKAGEASTSATNAAQSADIAAQSVVEAESVVATIPEAQLNDEETTLMNTWSANKITSELGLRVKAQNANITVQVPEDFATINQALSYLTSTFNPTHDFTAEVSIADGYIIAEQLLFDGQDLSWIKLTSRSATGSGDYPSGKHLVDRDALTINFGGGYSFPTFPTFGARNGASSPVLTFVLDGQVALGSGTASDNKTGIVAMGAKVNCSDTAGAINMSGYACYARAGGAISANIMINSSNSDIACYTITGDISADVLTNSSDSNIACLSSRSGDISANIMKNSSNSDIACTARASTVSANTIILSNSTESNEVLAFVVGGGIIRSFGGTWTDNGTGGKANQAAGAITSSGYISRIG